MPYPPSYTEIYPAVTEANVNEQMGWRQPEQPAPTSDMSPIITQPTQPPPYGTTAQQPQQSSNKEIKF